MSTDSCTQLDAALPWTAPHQHQHHDTYGEQWHAHSLKHMHTHATHAHGHARPQQRSHARTEAKDLVRDLPHDRRQSILEPLEAGEVVPDGADDVVAVLVNEAVQHVTRDELSKLRAKRVPVVLVEHEHAKHGAGLVRRDGDSNCRQCQRVVSMRQAGFIELLVKIEVVSKTFPYLIQDGPVKS